MPKKPKFRPKITRIKLNPEQAVLACTCWMTGTTVNTNPIPVFPFSSVCFGLRGQHTNSCTVNSDTASS